MKGKHSKVTVVGAGTIGSLLAYQLLLRKSAGEIALVNRTPEKAAIKAFDMSHCVPWLGQSSIIGGGFEKSAGSHVIVVTVGTLPKKDGSRMDVLKRNFDIYREMIPALAKLSPEAVFLVVTNPVDLMALAAAKYSEFPGKRVLGSGTLLDTLRFKSFIAEVIGVPPENIDGLIIGEHGESMVPLWSHVKVDGMPLAQYVNKFSITWNQEIMDVIMQKTRRAGWKIREGNEHSSYGIAFSAAMITEAILQDQQAILPVSIYHEDDKNSKGFFMSRPVCLGRGGHGAVQILDLTAEEQRLMDQSSEILKQHISTLDY